MPGKVANAISIPRELLDGGPADLADELENKARVPLRDMSEAAFSVIQKCWDRQLDTYSWPPPGDIVVMRVVR